MPMVIFFAMLLLPFVAPQSTDSKPLCNNPDFGRNVASPASCQAYYFCDSYYPQEKLCPTDQWFDLDSNRCQPQSLVECNLMADQPLEAGITCPTADTNTLNFVASKLACNRYIICHMERGAVHRCPNGLWWNQVVLECDDPRNVNCQIANDEEIEAPATTTTPRPAQQFNCPPTGVDFLPHPEHCNWFVYCRNGSMSVQQCQFMQHFDTVTKQCKFKFDATCEVPGKKEKI